LAANERAPAMALSRDMAIDDRAASTAYSGGLTLYLPSTHYRRCRENFAHALLPPVPQTGGSFFISRSGRSRRCRTALDSHPASIGIAGAQYDVPRDSGASASDRGSCGLPA
jgi:hypothetical protein